MKEAWRVCEGVLLVPCTSPSQPFREQCKWDANEQSRHQLVSPGCLKPLLWASGISSEQNQHKNCFLIRRQPLQATLGIRWSFTAASVVVVGPAALEGPQPHTFAHPNPTHTSRSTDDSNLNPSTSPTGRTSFPEILGNPYSVS